MKIGKTPRPDGISAKYYKTLSDQITPVLCEVMNNILKEGEIPGTWKEAHITVNFAL